MLEQISVERHKANKEHVCDFCRDKIKKGEIYERQTNKVESSVYTWKSHLGCIEVFNELNMSDYDDGYGIDSDTFIQIVDDYLYDTIEDEDERDRLISDWDVDLVVELLRESKNQ